MDPNGNNWNQELFCRGLKSDSQMCDCEEFFPRTQDEGHCAECGHGHSKHPRKASTSHEPVPEVQEDADEQPHSSSAVAIKDIFTRITGGKTVNDNLNSCHYREARKPTCWLSQAGQGPNNIGRLVKVKSPLKVNSLTQFLTEERSYQSVQSPKQEWPKRDPGYEKCGCYLEQQFIIESGWTYFKVTSQLRTWFPKVFDYLNVQVEKRQSAMLCEEKPIWRLLNKCGQMLTVVDIRFPAGSDLAKHKGQDKASVSDCHLWFVTRNQIPDSIYEFWNTQPVIAGSDSECDNGNDMLLSDTDDSVSIKSDNDLASSLMELDMSSDLDVKDPKGKGKAKVAPARSPMRRRNMKHSHTLLSPSPSEATRKAVQKKLKKEPANDTTVPLFSMNSESASSELKPPPSTQPRAQSNSYKTVLFHTTSTTSQVPGTLKVENKISTPPAFVSVSEADVLWRDKIQDDDPFTEYINPWDFHYCMLNLANLE
ncbi:hypothetical protein DFJ58DRAFT_736885 [Suillus subalutaceus]|uniref:uncharacterized protein n=1 Tax=Suillus subalutaceus TaxID=48586 RepID=UPI001B85CCA0|nr:uncharacterized protein DFJ58DRAFT_736885 [Suillus subalutaceus]KAG1830705.1 hypothetical protein DFJ58DRAFT_736885 [Suillus subalutaceus]